MPDPAPPPAAPAPAPAPPAPVPAPAPAPSPSPTPAPAPAPSGGDNPFGEIEAAYKKFGVEEPPKPAPTPEPPKSDKPEPPKPGAPQPGQRPEPKQLRQELERAKQEAATASKSLTDLQAKIREYEAKGRDTEALMARSQQLEKELETARSEIRAIKQEASPEFITKYKKPFDEAANYAKYVVEQLTLTDEAGDSRQATFEDLQQLYNMPINKASAIARKMFGDDSATVINHLNELHRLDYVYQNALKEERTNAAERSKAEEGKRIAARDSLKNAYIKISQELADSVPEYKDQPEDKEAVELRNRGYNIFDAQPETTEKAVIKQAHVRQMVAAFFPLKLTITRLQKEIADLKAKLKVEDESDPNKTKRPGGAAPPTDDNLSWEQGLRKHMQGS